MIEKELKNNFELNKYIKEFSKDIEITDYNIKEKSLTTSAIWAKWLSYLYHEKENLERISEVKQKILKKKLNQSKNQDSVLRLKNTDKILENDENIQKLNKLSKMTQDNIDYIERSLNILANFGFQIKNIIEVLKLNLSH